MSAKKRAANQMKPGAEARRPRVDPPPVPAAPPPSSGGGSKGVVKNVAIGLAVLLLGYLVYRKLNPTPPTPLAPKLTEQEKNWTSLVDGDRMWQSLARFAKPRVAGTPGSLQAQAMIRAELGAAGIADVRTQNFTAKTPEGNVEMANIIGVLPGKNKDGIALAAHYDSKKLDVPFVGANDAASAVVVLFELARKLKAAAPDRDLTYYFVFFDGEEAFRLDWRSWERETGELDHTYGSRHFVKKMDEDGYAVKALILLDMVGDKDYSLIEFADFSPELLAIFKNASKDAFGVDFLIQRTESLEDDYVPFLEEKIPVIDLIDFQYGRAGNLEYWHTQEDTIDKLDKRSLERTGTLVLTALPQVEKMILKGVQTGAPKTPVEPPKLPETTSRPK